MTTPPGPVPVRLVTFNTHHGVGDDGRHDVARIAGVLAAARADVICLQEVDRHFGPRSEHADQAQLLADALGMELTFGPAIDKNPVHRGGPRRQYGNALLSRAPVLSSRLHALPGSGEPRAALVALLALDGSALRVVATHLANGSRTDRAAQAAVVAGLVTGGAEPAVLAGDLNAGPDAAELAPLAGALSDAWRVAAAHGDRPRDAGRRFFRRPAGSTFPSRRPRARIDQVWVDAGVTVTAAEVLDGGVCSDHHPLQVDLAVARVGRSNR